MSSVRNVGFMLLKASRDTSAGASPQHRRRTMLCLISFGTSESEDLVRDDRRSDFKIESSSACGVPSCIAASGDLVLEY